jgi:hypothetical protein
LVRDCRSANWDAWNIELFGKLYTKYKDNMYKPVWGTFRMFHSKGSDPGWGFNAVSIGVTPTQRTSSVALKIPDNFSIHTISFGNFDDNDITDDSNMTASMASTKDGSTSHKMVVSIHICAPASKTYGF